MAIVCFNSFVKYNKQTNFKLLVHTDGSLSDQDIDRLRTNVDKLEVVDRKDHEEEVKEALAKYPNCLKYRSITPLSNKFLDIAILEKECIRFIDCDILFIRAFDKLFSDDTQLSRFCLEDDSGYSGRLVEIAKAGHYNVPKGCNVGIYQMDKKKYNLDYIEWFLSQKNLCHFPGMLDQTLMAIFMGAKDSVTYDDKQISTSKDKIKLNPESIAIHFMYGLKSQFFEFAKKYEQTNNQTAVDFRLFAAEKMRLPYIIKRALIRKLGSFAN